MKNKNLESIYIFSYISVFFIIYMYTIIFFNKILNLPFNLFVKISFFSSFLIDTFIFICIYYIYKNKEKIKKYFYISFILLATPIRYMFFLSKKKNVTSSFRV
jgi:hypothetical protein